MCKEKTHTKHDGEIPIWKIKKAESQFRKQRFETYLANVRKGFVELEAHASSILSQANDIKDNIKRLDLSKEEKSVLYDIVKLDISIVQLLLSYISYPVVEGERFEESMRTHEEC